MKGGRYKTKMNDKKGLSTVVTTLIIILLVLVAIGIVWFVVGGLLENSAERIDVLSECPLIQLDIVSASTCNASECSVSVNRKDGDGETPAGIRMVVTNGTASVSDNTDVQLSGFETAIVSINQGVENPTEVKVAAYFRDSNNEIKVCSQVATYSLEE